MSRSDENKRTAEADGGVADHSSGTSGGRKRLAPVLLSLLVFPGLGQFATGRPWRGLAYAGTSLALLAALMRRVYAEATRLMPRDPEALLDPALPFRLAAEIHRANLSFFAWITGAIVLLWALSALDAWAASRQAAGRASVDGPPPGGGGRP
jgi:hypothetical protein